jgi:hypothetical protein
MSEWFREDYQYVQLLSYWPCRIFAHTTISDSVHAHMSYLRLQDHLHLKYTFSISCDYGFARDTIFMMQGLSGMTVAHGKMFTVSSLAQGGAVNVFSMDISSGRLTEIPSLRRVAPTSADSQGMLGVRSLYVGLDFMYVASSADQAVSLWTLNATTGATKYVDHLRNGERLVGSFRTFVNDSVDATEVGWDGNFPTRLGGNQNPYSFYSRTVRPMTIDGRQMFGIAATTDAVGTLGVFHVSEWANGTMRTLQVLDAEVRLHLIRHHLAIASSPVSS